MYWIRVLRVVEIDGGGSLAGLIVSIKESEGIRRVIGGIS
jgi:hypothetical protein